MLSWTDGLYKILIVKLSLNGNILETVFSKASVTALCILGTEMILKAWK